MKNILIPTDFTKEQKNTVKYGVQMAKLYNSKITLLHMLTLSHSSSIYMATAYQNGAVQVPSAEVMEIQEESAEKSFDELLKEIRDEFGTTPPIETKIESGLDYQVIRNAANKKDFDLILLTGYEGDSFLESLADERMNIIEEVNAPVMLVPVNASFKYFKRVVYATDYKKEDIKTMNNLVRMVQPFFGFIYGIHVSKESGFDEMVKEEGFENLISERIGYSNLNVYSISRDSVAEGVLKFADEVNADLISVLREDKGFFERIFNNDKTKNITRKSDIPVLIFHE